VPGRIVGARLGLKPFIFARMRVAASGPCTDVFSQEIDAVTAIQYIHHTPGRLRIKGRHFNCHGARARRAVAELQALSGVDRVQLNAHAASLTVHYDPQLHGQAELLAVLEAAGCLHGAADVDVVPAAQRAAARDGAAGTFGKALLGALAQRTATRLIAALL
jgi:hypothetical protein